jgi:hypothetical protein
MDVLSKEKAEKEPVGDGQNEPNRDPYLEKPKEGRGVAAFLKGGAFSFGLWKIICK